MEKTRRKPSWGVLLASVPLVAMLPEPLPAQDAAAKRLEPESRYVDEERGRREARYAALSTARLERELSYRLDLDTENQEMRIRISGRVRRGGDLCFVMPAWSPGSYRVVNNGRQVKDLTASNGKRQEYAIERAEEDNPNIWVLRGARRGDVVVDYSLASRRFRQRLMPPRRRGRRQGEEREERGEREQGEGRSRARRARKPSYQFDGPKVWMHEISHKQLPCRVELRIPEDFDVATGLTPAPNTESGFVRKGLWRFTASDYDVLIDCPTRMGHFESFGFMIDGKPFEIALSGAGGSAVDRQEFARRVKLISEHFMRLFGGAPFERYVYLFTVPGGGGLEHLNSTAIGLMSLQGSVPDKPVIWDFVISHEFFHLWNVKRLRPKALGPFDYTGPNRTTALWFAEGVTSYYGAIAMPRTGLWSPRDYWRHMSNLYTRLRRNPARKEASVAESSWTVWDGRSPIGGRRIDYYLKGECLGLLLDVMIRDATDNERSFDDVMRGLYRQCMQQGSGFAEKDIMLLAKKASGRDMHEFFDRYVYGTDDLPVREVLVKAGLDVELTGEGRRARFRITEDKEASGLRLAIRKSLVDRWRD